MIELKKEIERLRRRFPAYAGPSYQDL